MGIATVLSRGRARVRCQAVATGEAQRVGSDKENFGRRAAQPFQSALSSSPPVSRRISSPRGVPKHGRKQSGGSCRLRLALLWSRPGCSAAARTIGRSLGQRRRWQVRAGIPATTPDALVGPNTSVNVIVPKNLLYVAPCPSHRRTGSLQALAAMRANPTRPAAFVGGVCKAPNTVGKRYPAGRPTRVACEDIPRPRRLLLRRHRNARNFRLYITNS